jgi:hypothetical protein
VYRYIYIDRYRDTYIKEKYPNFGGHWGVFKILGMGLLGEFFWLFISLPLSSKPHLMDQGLCFPKPGTSEVEPPPNGWI